MAKKDSGIVNIHGKQYKTVALRVTEFRELCKIDAGWGIETQLHHFDERSVIIRAIITDADGRIIGTGHGEEVRGSSNINKTSALENAETSAIGRALAACGFAGTEYASADEVANAISQQNAPPTGAPTDKQKKYLWSLIKRQPEDVQDDLIDRAKAATTADQVSSMIEKLK